MKGIRMPFKKGKEKTGGIKKGQKHKKTLLKEKLGVKTVKKIDEFAEMLIRNWFEFLSSEDDTVRLTATKELSKFVFPTKRQIESTLKPMTLEDFLREIGEGNLSLDEGDDENEVKRLGKS